MPTNMRVALKVRGQLLNVEIDGKHVLAYKIASPRRAGRLALWTFSAHGEFRHLVARTLPTTVRMRAPSETAKAQPKTALGPS